MPVYNYAAVDAAGRRVRGVIEGTTPESARASLRRQALTPISIGQLANRGVGALRARRSSAADITLFCRLTAALLEGGLEISEALNAAARQAERRAKPLYLGVHDEIAGGATLAQAVERVFGERSANVVAAIAAGEQSGRLAQVLGALADYGERREAVRSKIAMALIYPAVLFAVSCAVVLGLMTWVVPEITRVFDGPDHELPALTRALISVSSWLSVYGPTLVPGAVLAAGAGLVAWRHSGTRVWADALCLALPWVGPYYAAAQRERLLDTLGMLLGGGVPMVDAIDASARTLASARWASSAGAVARDVERGVGLDVALAERSLLPPVQQQLVAAGIESARLETMLTRAAALERNALEQRVGVFLALLEPLLILLLGGFVLVLVLAILQPIFALNHLIS